MNIKRDDNILVDRKDMQQQYKKKQLLRKSLQKLFKKNNSPNEINEKFSLKQIQKIYISPYKKYKYKLSKKIKLLKNKGTNCQQKDSSDKIEDKSYQQKYQNPKKSSFPMVVFYYKDSTSFFKQKNYFFDIGQKKKLIKQNDYIKKQSIPKKQKKNIQNMVQVYFINKDQANKIINKAFSFITRPSNDLKKRIYKFNQQNNYYNQKTIKKKNNNHFICKTIQQYSIRIGNPPDTKYFIFNSQDLYIKKILLKWGWVQNKFIHSMFFHFKWLYKDQPQDYKLEQGQYFNHFHRNYELTSKMGLHRSLKYYVTQYGNQLNNYFPISFDINNLQQRIQFIYQYNLYNLIIFFKTHLDHFQKMRPQLYQQVLKVLSDKLNVDQDNKTSTNHDNKNDLNFVFNTKIVLKCFNQTQKIKKMYKNKISKISKKSYQYIQIDQYLSSFPPQLFPLSQQYQTPSIKILYNIVRLGNWIKNKFTRQWSLLTKMNIWISKPIDNSKGNGIHLLRGYKNIISNLQNKTRILQKYIQKPLLFSKSKYKWLNNHKFDMRQWVLIKSFCPLTIFMFNTCYFRICSQQYEVEDYKCLSKHLTNYSQNKNMFKNKQQSLIGLEEFKTELLQQYGINWQEKVLPKIVNIIIESILSASGTIQNNKSCFQLYGYDILIDKNFNPWLLEINLSPACQQRTKKISEYLESMGQHLLRIILDQYINDNYQHLNQNFQKYYWIQIFKQQKLKNSYEKRKRIRHKNLFNDMKLKYKILSVVIEKYIKGYFNNYITKKIITIN